MGFISSKLKDLNVKEEQQTLEAYQTEYTILANSDQINILNPPQQAEVEETQNQAFKKACHCFHWALLNRTSTHAFLLDCEKRSKNDYQSANN